MNLLLKGTTQQTRQILPFTYISSNFSKCSLGRAKYLIVSNITHNPQFSQAKEPNHYIFRLLITTKLNYESYLTRQVVVSTKFEIET